MSRKRKKSSSTFLMPWWAWAAAIGGGFWLWVRQQSNLIQFGNVSIPFQQLKGGQINLKMVLPITNASSIGAKITGFTGFIISSTGNPISSVFLSAPAMVPPYAQAELQFNTSIRLTDAATEIFTIFQNGGKWEPKGYRLRGQVRVYGIPVPVDLPLI